MEERIIDDEYGRGIRLKKTEDGYVDVTDELAQDEQAEPAEQEQTQEAETAEEIVFEFPDLEEDDEDLVGLSPEEALELRKRKEAEAIALKEEYKKLCDEGNEMLDTQSYKAAELKFEKALKKDAIATEASVGYWRAKTSDFTQPDILIEEYLEAGYESLEYDLGYMAVEQIKKDYRPVFEKRLEELSEEEAPLEKAVTQKQENRRKILKERIKKSLIKFAVSALPMLALLALTIVLGMKIRSTPDGRFIWYTVASGVVFAAAFAVFGVFTNKLINALRINRANETLSSTEDGAKLLEIREYKELYARFLD